MLSKGIATIAVVATLVGTGCAGDPTQSSEFQQVEAQLAAAEADLAAAENAAEAAATTSQAELEAVRAEADRLESELADIAEARRAAGEAYARLAELVEVQVAWSMWVAPEDIEDMQSVGVDTSVADRIIEESEWGTTWESFALTGGGFAVNHLIAGLDDEALEAAWLEFNDSPIGSDEEYAAYSSFVLRLHELTIERLREADRLVSPPQEGAV
jgi:multidrug efflux pump subunit AcrA (membrane-fusion protein)